MISRLLSKTRFSKVNVLGPEGGTLHEGVVIVGEHTYGAEHISPHIWNSETKLRIGSYCSIADNVHVLLGGNHRMDRTSTYPFGQNSKMNLMPTANVSVKFRRSSRVRVLGEASCCESDGIRRLGR